MRFLSFVILAGFLSLSVFGFVGMLQSSDDLHGLRTCLASLAQNGACPPEDNIALALFHTNAFKVFSTSVLAAALVLALLRLYIGMAPPLIRAILRSSSNVTGTMNRVLTAFLAKRHLRLALVRFEHSPTSF